MPTDQDLKTAEDLLELSHEELLRKLTENREPGFVGDLVREGQRLYNRLAENQRHKICSDEHVQAAFRSTAGNRRLLIVCAIADVLGTAGAMSIAALIVQDGLEAYCETVWAPGGGRDG